MRPPIFMTGLTMFSGARKYSISCMARFQLNLSRFNRASHLSFETNEWAWANLSYLMAQGVQMGRTVTMSNVSGPQRLDSYLIFKPI